MNNKLNKIIEFWNQNVFFISWNKYWKGVYIHCLSNKYCHRIYLWGHDKHMKPEYLFGRVDPSGPAGPCLENK